MAGAAPPPVRETPLFRRNQSGMSNESRPRPAFSAWLSAARDVALDALFPIRCLECGAFGRFVCPPCMDALPKLRAPFCRVCASPGVGGVCGLCRERKPAVDSIRSPYLYERGSAVYRAISMLKYGGIRIAARDMGDWLAAFIRERRAMEADVLVAVPSHRSRVRRRGYAQASLIAAALAERLGKPLDSRGLERVRNAPSQLDVRSRAERWRNVQGGFAARSDFGGMRVLLIDDLVTTGATMSACAAALKAARARSVFGISVARAGADETAAAKRRAPL